MNANDAANALFREVWGNRGFPVDPAFIADKLGIDVFESELPNNVSGAIIKEQGEDPKIFLNQNDHKNRKRFSCAHEIGHYIYRLNNGSAHYEYVDLRGDLSGSGVDPEEIFANQFAANLLMPDSEVKRLHSEGKPDFIMSLYFSVSDDAMRIRLKNLGLK